MDKEHGKMAKFKDEQVTHNGLTKFDQWPGSWQSYLAYLDENRALSSNIFKQGQYYKLRPGFTPPWTLKDFK
jgi:hypothetical protein